MLKIFKRLFRIAAAKTHSTLDSLEDPVKMTEQGIRDLKKDLEASLQSLAEAKAILIGMRKEAQDKEEMAVSYENKAILLLKKAEAGGLSVEEADRLAGAALSKKEEISRQGVALKEALAKQEKQTQALEIRIGELKANISTWENELSGLNARAKVAQASRRLNQQLAQVDSSSTVALLEKMKHKVAAEEALAESYGEMATLAAPIDKEIDKALASSGAIEQKAAAADSLAQLKARLNLSLPS